MDDKKLLIVRVPAGDIPALEAMRDYVQASLQMGVLAVPEDTTLELMELPSLEEVMSAEYYAAVEELFEEPPASVAIGVAKGPPPEPVAIGVAKGPPPEPVALTLNMTGELPKSKLPDPETITFMGQGAEEKREILCRIRRYRDVHGVGCWKKVAIHAGRDVTEDLLRGIYNGEASPPIKVWRKIGKTLDKLESREEEIT